MYNNREWCITCTYLDILLKQVEFTGIVNWRHYVDDNPVKTKHCLLYRLNTFHQLLYATEPILKSYADDNEDTHDWTTWNERNVLITHPKHFITVTWYRTYGKGPVSESWYQTYGKGPLSESWHQTYGKGPFSVSWYRTYGKGPLRESYRTYGKGPLRESWYRTYGKGPLSESWYRTYSKGPLSESWYRTYGKGPLSESWYRTYGKEPLFVISRKWLEWETAQPLRTTNITWANLLPPVQGILFSISSNGSFTCTTPQTEQHTPQPLLHQLWAVGVTHRVALGCQTKILWWENSLK